MLYGQESWLKSYFCAEIAKRASGGMPDFNLHRFDCDSFDIDSVTAARDSMPMMSDHSCVVLRDIDPASLDDSRWKKLLALLKEIPDGCVFILDYEAVAYDKKRSKWGTLITLVKKQGVAAEINRLPDSDLEAFAGGWFRRAGCEARGGAVRELIERCGGDLGRMRTETDKLTALAGAGGITAQMVRENVAASLDASVYEISRAVLAGDSAHAASVIEELIYRREEPVKILAALSGSFCDLFRAKTALRSGVSEEQTARDFDYGRNDFKLRYAFADCRGISTDALRRCIELLAQADLALKSSKLDGRVVLERLAVEMAMTKRGNSR
jgi:DNA polymerase-3 subunit delta